MSFAITSGVYAACSGQKSENSLRGQQIALVADIVIAAGTVVIAGLILGRVFNFGLKTAVMRSGAAWGCVGLGWSIALSDLITAIALKITHKPVQQTADELKMNSKEQLLPHKAPSMSILNLNDDVFLAVVSQIRDVRDVLALAATCRRWYVLITQRNAYWIHRLKEDFSFQVDESRMQEFRAPYYIYLIAQSNNLHLVYAARDLRGHRGEVTCLTAFSNGEELVSGSKDGTLRVWNPSTGQEHFCLQGHEAPISCLTLLENRRLASGSNDVRVWDLAKGQEIWCFNGHTAPVTCLAASSNILAGSADQTVRVWNVDLGKECCCVRHEGEGAISFLVFVAERLIASAKKTDRIIRVWDVATGEMRYSLQDHKKGIECLSVFPNGKLVSGSRDLTVRIWNLTNNTSKEIKTPFTVTSCTMLPDGRLALAHALGTKIVDNKNNCSTNYNHRGLELVHPILSGGILGLGWEPHFGKIAKIVDPRTKRMTWFLDTTGNVIGNPTCVSVLEKRGGFAVGHNRGIVKVWTVKDIRSLSATVNKGPPKKRHWFRDLKF